ncbi:MAG: putative manganese transporter, partial [Rhodospirillaceae bacterium]
MTELILKGRAELARMGLGQGHASPQGQVIPDLPFGRLLAVAVVAVLIASPGVVGEAARGALADAYLAVAVFVAGTLALLAWAERSANVDLAKTLEGAGWARVPIAALLGAFPGCGGAVVVATQFARGKASFGSLVATLTATMGDAAILLLAQAPMTALSVIGISFVAGILLGWAVDAAHGERLGNALRHSAGGMGQSVPAKPSALVGGSFGVRPWMVLMVPGTVLGVLLAFQADPDAWIAALTGVAFPMTEVLGIAGAMLGLALWATRPVSRCVGGACGMPEGQGTRPLATRIMDDTNFVSAWVVFGFLAYEVTMAL